MPKRPSPAAGRDDAGDGPVDEPAPARRRRARALPDANPRRPNFTPETLDRTVIAIPLLQSLREESETRARRTRRGDAGPWEERKLIIDVNLEYEGGRAGARTRVLALIRQALEQEGLDPDAPVINRAKTEESSQYIFARLVGPVVRRLVVLDSAEGTAPRTARAIHRIWPDFPVRGLVTATISTVKADAAHSAFAAWGAGVVWAVVDSGIQGDHRHFQRHENLMLEAPLEHLDFTRQEYGPADPGVARPAGPPPEPSLGQPLVDRYGHGSHVAGIIAGAVSKRDPKPGDATPFVPPQIVTRARDEHGDVSYRPTGVDEISGMAPRCKLVSLKVLDDAGQGDASNVIAAIDRVQQLNGYGRRLLIHGVNLSVGYDFEPEWFACGQSPLCVEVDRLVRSGVIVVVAAGNTGYGYTATAFRNTVAAGLPLSINDPGNAELAITVGSTHRDMPHLYGVSYFSSKGPTGDGRLKPDLVAPGEKIVSCAAGDRRTKAESKVGGTCEYVEESGTSMAAPHVSGVIAAFLSVRREFIGRPERVKELFTSSATDLRRDRYFQGSGLVDLMRAIQSI